MTDEMEQQDISYMLQPPRDLHESYMRLRGQLSSSSSFYKLYLKLLSLVVTGAHLLPPQFKRLSDEVFDFIASKDAYPGKRQMQRSGNEYRLGDDTIGLIMVSQHDIEIGLRESIEQQVSRLLPRLMYYDNEILKILVDVGTVEKKRPILEDLLLDQTMSELSNAIIKKESGDSE